VAGHPFFAAAYDAALAPVEALGLAAQRRQLLAGARGRVLEVGGGTGLNLAHYLPSVTEVVVSEPDEAMRRRMAGRVAAADVAVSLVDSGVPGLAFDDASFDTVVCTLVLCTLAEPAAGLAELRRLVRDDGQVLFLEHVLGPPVTARVQRALAPAWARLAGGCRLDRDPIAGLRRAGFVVTDCERLAPLGRASAGLVVRGRAVPRLTPAVPSQAG